jgi:hypothetical protein
MEGTERQRLSNASQGRVTNSIANLTYQRRGRWAEHGIDDGLNAVFSVEVDQTTQILTLKEKGDPCSYDNINE